MTTGLHRLDLINGHLASLFDCTPLAVAVYDETDTLRYGNPAFRTLLGIDADDFSTWQSMMRQNHAKRVGTKVDAADFELWLASARSRRGKLPFRGFESDLTNGHWYYMTETVDAEGWMFCCAFDITSLRADERSLRVARDGALKAAQTDTLTGISNRLHILQLLDLQLQTLRQRQHSCAIVMLDLDHFKAVNDVHGHHGGDVVLKHFATMTGSALRNVDGFGRLGGEEFMILLPGIDESQLQATVDRLLAEVRQSRPLPDVPEFTYTCSAGAGMLLATEDAVNNIRRVDRALYQAKSQGHDRCVTLTSA